MRSKTRRIIGAAALICALAAGGAAFTGASSIPGTTLAGYGDSTVTGATATSLVYTLDATGTSIVTATLKFNSDLTAAGQPSGNVATVASYFGTAAQSACVVGAFAAGSTTVTCTTFAGGPINANAAIAFHVAVTNS